MPRYLELHYYSDYHGTAIYSDYSDYSDSEDFTTFGIIYHENTCLHSSVKSSHAISAISAITLIHDETDCGDSPRFNARY